MNSSKIFTSSVLAHYNRIVPHPILFLNPQNQGFDDQIYDMEGLRTKYKMWVVIKTVDINRYI